LLLALVYANMIHGWSAVLAALTGGRRAGLEDDHRTVTSRGLAVARKFASAAGTG
jgi:hypothetical protein